MAKKGETKNVTFNGATYSMDKLEEVAALHALLLPAKWPGKKADGVRLALSLLNMATMEFQRQFMHNFHAFAKTALELKEDGEKPSVGIGFKVDLDLSAPTVAAIGKTKMSFSRTFSTETKAKTHDINQGEFLAADLSVVLNTESWKDEQNPEEDEEGGEDDKGGNPSGAPKTNDKPSEGVKPSAPKRDGKKAAANDKD